MNCVHCGHVNSTDAAFCRNKSCGKMLAVDAAQPSSSQLISCIYCGHDNNADSTFCKNKTCGKMLVSNVSQGKCTQPINDNDSYQDSGSNDAPSVQRQAPSSQQLPTQHQTPPQQSQPQQQYQTQQPPPQTPKPNQNNSWLYAGIALAAALVIVLGIAFAGSFMGGGFTSGQEVIIDPRVLIYDEDTSPFTILGSDNYSVMVSSLDGINDDTILSADITDATPYGLLRMIDSIEPVDGGYLIHTIPAALTDAIIYCDVDLTAVFYPDGSYEIVSSDTLNFTFPGISEAHASGVTLPLFSFSEDRGPLSYSAGITIQMQLRINRGQIDLRVVNRLYANAELSLNYERSNALSSTILTKQLPPVRFWVGIPITFNNSLSVTAEIDASMSASILTIHASYDRQLGFEYTSRNGLRAINITDKTPPNITWTPQGDLFTVSSTAEITTSLSSRLFNLAGPSISVGIRNNVDARLERIPNADASSNAFRIPGLDWSLGGSVTHTVTLPIRGTFELAVPRINPFSPARTLASQTLFDTGDSIELYRFEASYSPAPSQEEAQPPTPPSGIAGDASALMGVWIEDDGYTRIGEENFRFSIDGMVDCSNFTGSLWLFWENHIDGYPVIRLTIDSISEDGSVNFSGQAFSQHDPRSEYPLAVSGSTSPLEIIVLTIDGHTHALRRAASVEGVTPNVEGLYSSEALAILTNAGLVHDERVHHGPPSNRGIPAGMVYNQSPEAGAPISGGDTVTFHWWRE